MGKYVRRVLTRLHYTVPLTLVEGSTGEPEPQERLPL